MLSRAEFAHLCATRVLIVDGAVGTLLMDKGLEPGQAPEAVFKVDAADVSAREFCNLHGLWKG